MSEPTRRALVLGSGRRIRNNFLPALSRLTDRIEVAGLWSRTSEHAERAAAPWGTPLVHDLDAALGAVDTVIMSVATAAVPAMLDRLAAVAPRVALVVDTPVFGHPRHLTAMSALSRFERVVVAEDYMNYPQWELTRTAVAAGLIGPVQRVELRHSGYRYHGLALIRSLYGFPVARSVGRHHLGEDTVWVYRFGAHRRGVIVEPYDQAEGTTTIHGRDGVITDDPALVATDRPVHRLTVHLDAGAAAGVTLGPLRLDLPQLPALLDAPVPDTSAFNALKTCGLTTVLSSLWEPNVNDDYGYRQALYDHLTTAAGRKLPFLVDPVAAVGANYVGVLDRVLGRCAPWPAQELILH